MTPALPDILVGQAAALATPLPPESQGEYLAGRVGIMALLSGLAAQEADRGPAARVWENRAIAELIAKVDHGPLKLGDDFSWRGLDAENARLRWRLIEIHEAAEARGDAALQTDILQLYVEMASARRLTLGG
ncbi:MAG TPA: hypothetical protein VGF42_08760 [Caulobacteraceae bacterium]|jgi:hypothetical protein